jgi:antirestriction protein ArdC
MGASYFGSQDYSKEELVAEMGSAMLCGFAGISAPVIENQAAYIQGWLSKLRKDNKLIVHAASAGQKAADYILGRKFEPAKASEPKAERIKAPSKGKRALALMGL